MTTDMVAARSAIESLRSGVPSRHATSALGTTQHRIRERFEASLAAVQDGDGSPPLVVAANFGAGKSHLLSCLRLLAEQAGFVTAAVVVSPETPLGAPRAVLRNIAEDAHAPGRAGNALRALLSPNGLPPGRTHELRHWIRRSGFDDRFAALLQIYEDFVADEELREQILADFEDRAISKSLIKAKLKELGQASAFDLTGPASTLLGHERIQLLAQLYRASGAAGLVVLFDEVERLAKFSLNQRLRALAEIGWWCEEAVRAGTAIVPVFAMTDLFLQTSVTGGTNDAARLTDDERDHPARLAVDALQAHEALDPPDAEQEAQVLYRIKGIYEAAYGGKVAPVPVERHDVLTPMRYKIRKWIARWDLQRYEPGYAPELAVDAVQFDEESYADADVSGEDDAAE